MATLTLRDLRKSYGSFEVIKGIDLDIADREFVVFVGPSGCGKSTLLRMIAGLEEITAGDLSIDGKRVNRDRARGSRPGDGVPVLRAVSAHDGAPEHGLRPAPGTGAQGRTRPQGRGGRAHPAAWSPISNARPRELSGGQRQRVAIGRAIVRQSEGVPVRRTAVQPRCRLARPDAHRARRGCTRNCNATMIYVTHDQVEAMTMADKIVVLQAGRVEQVGSPLELYHHPANLFVAGFIGSPRMNLLPGQASSASMRRARWSRFHRACASWSRSRPALPGRAMPSPWASAPRRWSRIDAVGPIRRRRSALVERLGG